MSHCACCTCFALTLDGHCHCLRQVIDPCLSRVLTAADTGPLCLWRVTEHAQGVFSTQAWLSSCSHGTAGLGHSAMPALATRHCRPWSLGNAGLGYSAMPALVTWQCRPWSLGNPGLGHTAVPAWTSWLPGIARLDVLVTRYFRPGRLGYPALSAWSHVSSTFTDLYFTGSLWGICLEAT